MDFGDMTPIFGEVTAVWSAPSTSTLEPFLFRVNGLQNDPSGLRIIATDFQANTFEAIRSRHQLEDMRDNIGIGGNWSDFVDYIITSLKSEDVKLIVEGQSESGGASHAKLIAQKGKGMPRMSVSLAKLLDVAAASQAMANLSRDLYKEYKNVHKSLAEEQERSYNLTIVVAAEREKNDSLQMMLYSRKNKSQKIDTENSDSKSASGPQDASDKQISQNQNSTKVPNRVVPAHRRAKVRGAVLVDTEDDD